VSEEAKSEAMCTGIALPVSELPEDLVRLHERRLARREGSSERELRFLFRDPEPELPLSVEGHIKVYPWGNRDAELRLPRTGWCRQESLEAGLWRHWQPQPVIIPAAFGLERGVWFVIKEGLQGIMVWDRRGRPHVYMLTQPATPSYQLLTRHARMPVLINQHL